jgi:hypothetical protein
MSVGPLAPVVLGHILFYTSGSFFYVVRFVKRDGGLEVFDRGRIERAVLGAMRGVGRPEA